MKLSTKEHSVKLKITKCRRGGSLRPPKNFLQINGRALKTLPYKKIIFSNTENRRLCSPKDNYEIKHDGTQCKKDG